MDIVEELRKDRENGAKRLVSEYKAGLMSLARRFYKNESDAEELVNATFAKVVANIDDYLEQSAFFAWMCQILTNEFRDSVKRKSNKVEIYPGVLPEIADEDAQEEIFRNLDHSLLRDAIETLPGEMKEAIMLHYIAEQPVPVVARFLRLPVSTVKWRLHVARKELARRLGAEVKEAVRKPGVKATLAIIAFIALTAAGAAGIARWGELSERAAKGEARFRATSIGETGETGGSGGFSPFAPISMPVPPDSPVPPVPDVPSTTSSEETTMNTATTLRTLAASAAIAAATASARTVYDAGKALRQNGETGNYANPYGVWSYYYASNLLPFSGTAFESTSTITSDKLAGWKNWDHQHLKVNVTGQILDDPSLIEAGEPLEVDEMYFHPERNLYTVLRFTVPEDGWYSAFASFHDVNQEASPQATSGVDVHVTLGSEEGGDTELASTLVTLESYPAAWGDANRTQRFDYQMPARYLTQGMRIQFAVGPNGSDWAIPNDGTGVKVLVIKEDEGRFYDSGVAFTTNVEGGYANPYGTAAHGTWHALLLQLSTSAAWTDFQSWIPQNLENSFEHAFTVTFPVGDGREGFKTENGASEPYVLVNPTDGKVGKLSPRELCVHPPSHEANQCTVVRFRPPEAGRYSASVVARYLENGTADGVEVFLVAADKIITNSVVSGDHVKSTMHLTFDNLLLAAAEPVDIIVSPRSAYWSDATAVSAIFRREDGAVYDANKSFYAHHEAGNTSVPFDDVLGGGAQWSVGSMTGSWLPNSFAALSGFVPRQNSNSAGLSWWEHSPDDSGSMYPRIAMTTNAVASWDKTFYITEYPRLAIAANEIFVHPESPGGSTSCAAVRAIVPSNGVYRVRGRARDLDNSLQYTDGIRFTLALGGYIPATSLVQMNYPVDAGVSYEASLEGDRLWLKAGETVDAVVDPGTQHYCDSTGLGLCYECEGDGTASVVNVDFTGTGSGKLSANAARAREGYGDCLSWNALRPGAAADATVTECYEADGATRRNMTVALAHGSGAAIATGSAATGTTLLDSFVTSSGSDDTYAFTISKLKKNEPYTLYLYSADGSSSGNATFTVGGVTKVAEGLWMLRATPMLTRFDVVSDASGEISGTFAAADGNCGAFNGLTLVGDLPDYKAPQFTIIIR